MEINYSLVNCISFSVSGSATEPNVRPKEDERSYKPYISRFLPSGHWRVGCSNSAELVEGDDLLVLSGVTLIDGTGAPPKENAVIVVLGDRILRVGAVGQYRFPNNVSILELDGRHVVPGFIDTHVHPHVDESAQAEMMSTLLGFGITTIRAPGTLPGRGVELRRRLANGVLLGPRMFVAAFSLDAPGNPLNALQIVVKSGAEARAAVRRQVSTGIDYVKLYMGVSDSLVAPAIQEAHSQGVKVVGHLKQASWTHAAQAGIDGLVHSGSDEPIWELLDDQYRDRFPWDDWGSYLRAWSETANLVDLEGPRMNTLVQALLEGGVEVNPTLVLFEALYWGDDPTVLESLEPAYAPTALTQTWGENWQEANPFMRQWNLTNEEWGQLKRAFVHTKEMIRHFHERGVLITAGSDVGMP